MFKNIFYWFYYYFSKNKREDDPEHVSYLFLCMMQFFNVATVFLFLNICFNFYHGEGFPWDTGKGRFSLEGLITGFVLGLPFLIFNYTYIYRKKRRKEIIGKYKRLKGKERMKSKAFFWIYVILSTFLCFYTMYLYSKRDKDKDIHNENKHQTEYRTADSTGIFIPDIPDELYIYSLDTVEIFGQ